MKSYKINDKHYMLADEPTIAQDELFAGIISDAGLGMTALTGQIHVDTFLSSVSKNKLLRRLLAIILVPMNQEFDETSIEAMEAVAAKMKTTPAMEAIKSFFGQNRSWIEKLKGFSKQLLEPENPQTPEPTSAGDNDSTTNSATETLPDSEPSAD
jgi:hypothetical protein